MANTVNPLSSKVQVDANGSTGRLPPGKQLGRYTILEPLGLGAMGTVYRGRDAKLERDVAIKILSPGVLTSEETRRRFRREALALGKLSHSHIAAVYDVGEQDGVDYLVLECVAGETLAAKLKAGPLSLQQAATLVVQIAQALEEAHEQGVVHRDLKPANVMITPKGNAKVLDFGIAKLFEPVDATSAGSILETGMLAGTPLYMSPEQAEGRAVDARTDLWSLGVLYYEALTGRTPFAGDGAIAVLHSILKDPPAPLDLRVPALPSLANRISTRALQKDPANRYQSAGEMGHDASTLLTSLTSSPIPGVTPSTRLSRFGGLVAAAAVLAAIGIAFTGYNRYAKKRWVLEEAIPQAVQLIGERKPLAAFQLVDQARKYLPDDPQLQRIAQEGSTTVSVTSVPANAIVSIQDYLTPDAAWSTLGVTPLAGVVIPKGYFRWKLSRPGQGDLVTAPLTETAMSFRMDVRDADPPGMVLVPASTWTNFISFVGWQGPYKLPPFYIDRLEVTNRQFQNFVDSGGYEKKQYWPATFKGDGRELTWSQAMEQFRDTSHRPGPSNWLAGHYPEGQADLPVAGVSWFEASAYATFADKQLPILSQWLQVSPGDSAGYTIPLSNIDRQAVAPTGKYRGLGPYGTLDMVGNVREWTATAVDGGLRFIAGGSWKSPSYLASIPDAASPFDRSDSNGFRTVKNLAPLPEAATKPVQRVRRDFLHYKPASDNIFEAYKLLFAYPNSPLHATEDGVVKETADWRQEKVTYDTGYRGERMSAYLFLPKRVKPPYQAVIFFPSARIYGLRNSAGGRGLGDLQFFDYILQSGRAVIYPIYQDTYERKVRYSLPSGSQAIQTTTDWYKDTARSLDYLQTRPDIDSSKLAYLGASMGAAQGVFNLALLQDKLKTAIFLDGGFFQDPPPPGGDQADFAPRIKAPILMVNGKNDYVFSVEYAQDPLFKLLGTPPEHKRHVLLDTPHDVTEQRPALVRNVLDWLDQYLGPVKQ